MSRINRISKLCNCGIFRNFEWPKELPDFGQFNLIYGWNGTGKTTLSRLLRCLETKTLPKGNVKIEVEGQELTEDKFPENSLYIRVFNRDFIHENVFPAGGGDLPPIFIIGAKDIEKQKQIEHLKKEYSEAQLEQSSLDSEKENEKKKFEEFCTEKAKSIKETLRASGSNPYNNYDKSSFKKDADNLVREDNVQKYLLSQSSIDNLKKQISAAPKPKVSEITYTFPNLPQMIGKVERILKTTIVSAALQEIKDDPSLTEWIRKGLGLHKERKSDKCLFCEQPLPAERLAKLEAHFNAEYERFLQEVKDQIDELELIKKQITELKLPHRAELYDELSSDYDAVEKALQQELEFLKKFIEMLLNDLRNKEAQPFKPLPLTAQGRSINDKVINDLNEIIRRHNQQSDNFSNIINEARKQLANHMIAEALPEYKKHKEKIQEIEGKIHDLLKEIEDIGNRREQLERDIVEHRRPAEELNEDLQKYLGHNELKLAIKETGYEIIRGREPATALSEGEMTAIALLYFLKTLKDKNFDIKNGIIVLDDPVSSLDANTLYLAYGFIRACTKDAMQLFILTHNFGFFQQVKNWFHHLPHQKKRDPNKHPARFYMIDCTHGSDGRCATIRRLDPLLERYNSEYHYLFSCIYRSSTETMGTNLEHNYMLPNMARRLLEGFLAFRQPGRSGELWQKMKTLQFDEAKKLRILRFVHTFSHTSGIGELEHDPSLLAEAPAVMKDLLELIKSQDGEHYKAMEQLVISPTESEGDVGEEAAP
jgi:wobble nucleotide-excising tRNase